MTVKLTLYSRQDCCLCDEMKTVIQQVAAKTALYLVEIDVDSNVELQAKYGSEVPVLFINGHKAFKYRLTAAGLTRKLHHQTRPIFSRLGRILGKESS
jgi:glutaredoxin